MLFYFYSIYLLYFIFVACMIYGWDRIKCARTTQKGIIGSKVSVVVAVRNEEKNVIKLLQSLASQAFQNDQWEIIIVDDRSTDQTASLITNFSQDKSLPIKLIKLSRDSENLASPKKEALSVGINQATGDYIVLTDGDCFMEKDWLKAMVTSFMDEKVKFVSGPVVIADRGTFFSKMQALEFSSLLGTGAAMLRLGYPLMCNGANIAFRKNTFVEVDGYRGVDDTATGDDVFLMQKIFRKYPESLFFSKDRSAIVRTVPAENVHELINQRIRWASKWKRPMLWHGWVLPVFLFLFYVSFLLTLPAMIFSSIILHAVVLVGAKIIFDYILLKKVTGFCQAPMTFRVFLLSELIYPCYAVYIGLSVHFSNWQWKGRTFNK